MGQTLRKIIGYGISGLGIYKFIKLNLAIFYIPFIKSLSEEEKS